MIVVVYLSTIESNCLKKNESFALSRMHYVWRQSGCAKFKTGFIRRWLVSGFSCLLISVSANICLPSRNGLAVICFEFIVNSVVRKMSTKFSPLLLQICIYLFLLNLFVIEILDIAD